MKTKEVTERRNTDQNRLLWACLSDVAAQVKWPVDGELILMAPADWKAVFTAALTKHQRVAKGIDGGWVMLGTSTSRMTKSEMADLITLIHAFGAERDVAFTDPDDF